MDRFHLHFLISNEYHGVMLKDYLKEIIHISKRALTDIKHNGGDLLVNGSSVTVRYMLKSDDELVIYFPPEVRGHGLAPEDIPLDIKYEDNHIVVINKPPNMAVIPSKIHHTNTLSHALIHHYDINNIPSTIHIVNRLDRNTSGLILVAKHRYSHFVLSTQQKSGNISRTYQAIVHGIINEDQVTINQPIGRNPDSIIQREVRQDGQHAITHFEVLDRFSDNYTYIKLQLETGRTHQIRVHMSAIGHSLIGDDLYGGSKEIFHRQALHSASISFHHPFTNQYMSFESGLPTDMDNFLKENK